jgi:hypothetical protein
VGKIADAYVEIGADDKPFREQLKDLSYSVRRMSFNIRESLKEAFSADNIGNLVTALTGSGDAGWVASGLISAGFGKAMLVISGVTAAAAAAALALDAVFSRDDDQKFADSVAGLSSGFRGLAEEIKYTDGKIKELMEADATGGGGGWISVSSWKALGERILGIETLTSQIARNMDNAVTASKLFADNMVRAAMAGQQQADQRKGAEAAAGLILSAPEKRIQQQNAAAFQRTLDINGGAISFNRLREFFRSNPNELEPRQSPMEAAQNAFGALQRGDPQAAERFGQIFGLAEEKAKMAVDEWLKAIPATNELAKLEEQRIERQKDAAKAQFDLHNREVGWAKWLTQEQEKQATARRKEADEMNRKTEQAARDIGNLQDQEGNLKDRLAEFQQDRADRLRDSFQFAGLGEARDRLFMAAQDAKKDDLTASKMQTEIDRVVKALDALKLKWEMN